MESADHIIDIGPEAGLNGGQVVVQGDVKKISNEEKSITGNYLSGKKFINTKKKKDCKKWKIFRNKWCNWK